MLRHAAGLLLLGALTAAPASADAAVARVAPDPTVQVIVELEVPAAARAATGRTARAALAAVDRAARAVEARIRSVSPRAEVGWRYRVVLAGLSIALPDSDLRALERLPGVRAVYPSVTYHATGAAGPQPWRGGAAGAGHHATGAAGNPSVIGAPAVWGPGLEHAGQGIRIGIIDDGIDQDHQYFDPAGFTLPPGFPKGNAAYTTAKVIVARAFPPPGATWRYAGRPFDPIESSHGTHVAGIAAGNAGTSIPAQPGQGAREISGVAPRAYLGNYKALTVPTVSGVGLDGNSPEIVAAIEAAVVDGMDVINLSLGEPQIDPSRDAVAIALDNAAAAGVIPVVAAGNEYLDEGGGSVGSPGTSARAITVAATDEQAVIASFSSAGPSPLGLVPKPDVAAPGVDVLSAFPEGSFDVLSGTSMASPMVAGGAALLRQLQPGWTVDEIKEALVATGQPVWRDERRSSEVSTAREGGGLVDLTAAADPRVFVSPQSLGLGFLDVSNGPSAAEEMLTLSDAGGGAGSWAVSVVEQGSSSGVTMSAPTTIDVPGTLRVSTTATAAAAEGERTGFIVLERNGIQRRVPFWLRVTNPVLGGEPFGTLRRDGTYGGDTRGRQARVDRYRYPDPPAGVIPDLAGPEQVFRIDLDRPVANLGVAVIRASNDMAVEPRIVAGVDENRLAGATSLPFVANPYLPTFLEPTRSAAALLPTPGTYSIVFDEETAARAGAFRFRLWIDDVTPPTVRLLSPVARNGRIRARVADAGSGVDPTGILYTVDGRGPRRGRLDARRGIAILDVRGLSRGPHRLELQVWDRQESKNNENVARILPNTRFVTTTIRVR